MTQSGLGDFGRSKCLKFFPVVEFFLLAGPKDYLPFMVEIPKV